MCGGDVEEKDARAIDSATDDWAGQLILTDLGLQVSPQPTGGPVTFRMSMLLPTDEIGRF